MNKDNLNKLKKPFAIAILVIAGLLLMSYFQKQRQKELDAFIQMQSAPLQKAEEKKIARPM